MKVALIMSSDPVTVRQEASLDFAMDLIDERGVRHLPVINNRDELVGVISDRDLLEATGWLHPRQRDVLEAPLSRVSQVLSGEPQAVTPEDGLDDALGLLVQNRIGCLPVLHEGKLAGMVSELDILAMFADAHRAGRIARADNPPIRNHMTAALHTISEDVAGDEAATLLRKTAVRHLPVVNDGKVVGMLSDRDVRRAKGCGELEVSLVGEIMSTDPIIAQADDALSAVAQILCSAKIGAVPVLEQTRLVGITSTVDVLIPCARALQQLG